MKYEKEVKAFTAKLKNDVVKDEVLSEFNYINREFANDLANIQRDYELGLCDDNTKRDVLVKCYKIENKLRSYLGLEPLPEIDLSIL